MGETGSAFFCGVVITAFICGGFALSKGCRTENHIQSNAVEAGAGEYYLDRNHEKKFRYKVPLVCKEIQE